MRSDWADTFQAVGEFTIWMGGAESSADEVLFAAVKTYGQGVRDVELPRTGKVLADYPGSLRDRFCMAEALANELCSKPPKWSKVAGSRSSLGDTVSDVDQLRNGLFHGQLQGSIDDQDLVSRRFRTVKNKGKAKCHEAVNVSVTRERLPQAIRNLRNLCIYFELCQQSMFWDMEGWPESRTHFFYLRELDLSAYLRRNAAGEYK